MKICSVGVDNLAGKLVAPVPARGPRDIDVLWVSHIDGLQRPDRALSIARRLPQARLHGDRYRVPPLSDRSLKPSTPVRR